MKSEKALMMSDCYVVCFSAAAGCFHAAGHAVAPDEVHRPQPDQKHPADLRRLAGRTSDPSRSQF